MRDDPIKVNPQHNSLVIAQNAYMSLDPRLTAHNCNLAVLGATDEQFTALVKANLGQGSCNYVVLTSSEESYNEISAVLVHHGYNVAAYDLKTEVPSNRELPSDLLGRSEAAAIFLLYDPASQDSCARAAALISLTLRAVSLSRSQMTGTGRPPHIQLFLSGFDHLPAIPSFPQSLVTARSRGIGICISIAGCEPLATAYPGTSRNLLDHCDIHLLYGVNQAKPEPPIIRWLKAQLRLPAPANYCEIHVSGLAPRRVIPLEKE